MSDQRKALIVANDQYEQEALRNLLAPAADAEALRRVLGDPQIGGFAVQVVHNEPSYVIQAQIEDLFSDSRPDDLLLLHFSGHGLKSESGELFFAASNTRPNRLGSTAVSADFVWRCMQDSRSHSVVLLLDCCYGGAFPQGVKVRTSGDVNVLDSFPHERTGGGRGRAVITASNAMGYAFEGDQLADDRRGRPSVFTNALVEGLATGDADRDEDGWISLNELYDYVYDKVREQNPHQTPSRKVDLEGELYLARSRRRRIHPVPIPPDLQVALTETNTYARLGAVSELRSQLASDNLPAAVGAYEALAELARTDIQSVANPATAALSDAAVQPAQTELHFGRIKQGAASPHQIVQLLGPPIARACVPRPSNDWIRVDQVAEGLDISIDTTRTGALHGSLDLRGPTGQAVIDIDIDLVSPALAVAAGSVVLGVLLFILALLYSNVWPLSSDTMTDWIWLSVAVLGVIIVALERPLKRLETLVHGWNCVWFIFLALLGLKLHFSTIADRFTTLYAVGAIGNSICATLAFVRVARGARGASNMVLLITTGLITASFLIVALGIAMQSDGLWRSAGVILLATCMASIIEAVVVLTVRSPSETGPSA